MALALDIAVVLIVIISAFVGYYRGFIRYVIKLLGTIVCIILAFIISDMTAKPVYEKFVAPRIATEIESQLADFDIVDFTRKALAKEGIDAYFTDNQLREALQHSGDLSTAVKKASMEAGIPEDKADQLKDEIDDYITSEFTKAVNEKIGIDNVERINKGFGFSDGVVYDLIKALADDDKSVATTYITENLAEPFLVTIVRYVLFILILIVAESIMSIIFAIAKIFDKMPAVNRLNRILGLLLGLVNAAIYLVLMAYIASAIITVTADNSQLMSFNTGVIDKTYIFKHIFYIFYK